MEGSESCGGGAEQNAIINKAGVAVVVYIYAAAKSDPERSFEAEPETFTKEEIGGGQEIH